MVGQHVHGAARDHIDQYRAESSTAPEGELVHPQDLQISRRSVDPLTGTDSRAARRSPARQNFQVKIKEGDSDRTADWNPVLLRKNQPIQPDYQLTKNDWNDDRVQITITDALLKKYAGKTVTGLTVEITGQGEDGRPATATHPLFPIKFASTPMTSVPAPTASTASATTTAPTGAIATTGPTASPGTTASATATATPGDVSSSATSTTPAASPSASDIGQESPTPSAT
ncbi:hypothetical protein [Streptomyces sp. NPDC001404]|uniref:hypothetical protein n=1 Tax=Streptomyces sp. NPDC001404 TaxID=3364571 RepID=UPI00368510DE